MSVAISLTKERKNVPAASELFSSQPEAHLTLVWSSSKQKNWCEQLTRQQTTAVITLVKLSWWKWWRKKNSKSKASLSSSKKISCLSAPHRLQLYIANFSFLTTLTGQTSTTKVESSSNNKKQRQIHNRNKPNQREEKPHKSWFEFFFQCFFVLLPPWLDSNNCPLNLLPFIFLEAESRREQNTAQPGFSRFFLSSSFCLPSENSFVSECVNNLYNNSRAWAM